MVKKDITARWLAPAVHTIVKCPIGHTVHWELPLTSARLKPYITNRTEYSTWDIICNEKTTYSLLQYIHYTTSDCIMNFKYFLFKK